MKRSSQTDIQQVREAVHELLGEETGEFGLE